jgi:hypothetical protein
VAAAFKEHFLHGTVEEDIYMKQPPSFENSQTPHYICKLDKALYDLKQAPQAWYSRLSTKSQEIDFIPSKEDTSLFLYNQSGDILFVLIYVVDIIATSSPTQAFYVLLHEHDFALKD